MRRLTRCGIGLAAALLLAAPALGEEPAAGELSTAPASDMDDAARAALRAEIRSYLLENPEILIEMYALLEERQRAAAAESEKSALSENAEAIFDDGFSHVGGNPEGDVTIVEFLDYRCGYCRRAQPELAELVETDGNIRWIIKEFPILGPDSELAARAAIATLIAEGGAAYARLHEALMSGPPVTGQNLDAVLQASGLDAERIRAGMDAAEVTERIAATRALAEKLAIAGTPTFVFEDELVRGYVPLEQMQALVSEKRAAEGG